MYVPFYMVCVDLQTLMSVLGGWTPAPTRVWTLTEATAAPALPA